MVFLCENKIQIFSFYSLSSSVYITSTPHLNNLMINLLCHSWIVPKAADRPSAPCGVEIDKLSLWVVLFGLILYPLLISNFYLFVAKKKVGLHKFSASTQMFICLNLNTAWVWESGMQMFHHVFIWKERRECCCLCLCDANNNMYYSTLAVKFPPVMDTMSSHQKNTVALIKWIDNYI